MNLRNTIPIKLARLRPTSDLRKRLPLRNVSLTPKHNGRRYSLQGGPSGLYLVSRNKHLKSRGVEFAKTQEFVVRVPEWWMLGLHHHLDFLAEGELCSMGTLSVASEVTRKDTEKEFIAFDLLWCTADLRAAPHSERLKALGAVVKNINHPRFKLIDATHFDIFTEDDLERCLSVIRELGIEGFALKECDRDYDHNWWGWKIKIADNEDGFVVDVREEKKSTLGVFTRTGLTGTMEVAQYVGGRVQSIAFVPIPDAERVPLENKAIFLDRVVEFSHSGWSGKEFSFPQFVQWRTDKPKDECLFKELE